MLGLHLQLAKDEEILRLAFYALSSITNESLFDILCSYRLVFINLIASPAE